VEPPSSISRLMAPIWHHDSGGVWRSQSDNSLEIPLTRAGRRVHHPWGRCQR
jgi:hypothetical protein